MSLVFLLRQPALLNALALGLTILAALGCGDRGGRIGIAPNQPKERVLLFNELDDVGSDGFITLSFTIVNSSDQRAKVSIGNKSCSCLRANLIGSSAAIGAPVEIEARSSGTCELSFELRRLEQRHRAAATIIATFPDGTTETHVASGTIHLYDNISVKPAHLTFDITPTARNPHEFSDVILRSRERTNDLSVQIFKVPPWISIAETPRMVNSNRLQNGVIEQVWRFRLKCNSDSAFQSSGDRVARGNIEVKTVASGGDSERRMILAIARRTTGVCVTPLVDFGKISVGHSYSRRLSLRSADLQPFRVQSISDNSPIIRAAFSQTESANEWIRLTFSPDKLGRFSDIIEVKTNHTDSPLLRIRIQAEIAN